MGLVMRRWGDAAARRPESSRRCCPLVAAVAARAQPPGRRLGRPPTRRRRRLSPPWIGRGQGLARVHFHGIGEDACGLLVSIHKVHQPQGDKWAPSVRDASGRGSTDSTHATPH
jgi:hypothetical protein